MIIPMHKAGTTIPTITRCSCSITGSREEKKKKRVKSVKIFIHPGLVMWKENNLKSEPFPWPTYLAHTRKYNTPAAQTLIALHLWYHVYWHSFLHFKQGAEYSLLQTRSCSGVVPWGVVMQSHAEDWQWIGIEGNLDFAEKQYSMLYFIRRYLCTLPTTGKWC